MLGQERTESIKRNPCLDRADGVARVDGLIKRDPKGVR